MASESVKYKRKLAELNKDFSDERYNLLKTDEERKHFVSLYFERKELLEAFYEKPVQEYQGTELTTGNILPIAEGNSLMTITLSKIQTILPRSRLERQLENANVKADALCAKTGIVQIPAAMMTQTDKWQKHLQM